jgi:hypothetical protein
MSTTPVRHPQFYTMPPTLAWSSSEESVDHTVLLSNMEGHDTHTWDRWQARLQRGDVPIIYRTIGAHRQGKGNSAALGHPSLSFLFLFLLSPSSLVYDWPFP